MAFAGSAADRLAIRELLDTYADAVARHDAAAWGACWTEDGVWHFAGHVLTGRAAIVAAWQAAMAPFALADFNSRPGAIEIAGDTATIRSWSREFFVLAAGGTRHISGRYDDELIRTPAGWRFAVRRYELLHDEVRPAS